MGGSLAMALKDHVNCITASDTRPEVLVMLRWIPV